MKPNIPPKHYLIGFLGIFLSILIYWANDSLGVPFFYSLYLSFFTFLLWYGCWLVYFEIRDIWNNRWRVNQIDTSNIIIQKVNIPLKNKKSQKQTFLHGEWLKKSKESIKSPIVIVTHGFSDNIYRVRQLTIPIVDAGFEVVSYDNRGTAQSRKAGKKNQFQEIIFDLKQVIVYVKNSVGEQRPIYLLGASLGSMAAIYQGIRFYNKGVEKIITLATIGDFQYALPHSPILFKKKWWIWIRYKFFGVPINPLEAENKILSPIYQIKNALEKNSQGKAFQDFLQNNIFLIHTKNDPIITFSHFLALHQQLSLNEKNWLICKTGGHNFIKLEPVVITQIIKFLKN